MKKKIEEKQVVKNVKAKEKSLPLGEKQKSYTQKEFAEAIIKSEEEKEKLSNEEKIIKVIYGGNKAAFYMDFPELEKKEPIPGQDNCCKLSINPFRTETRKDTPQELLNQHLHLFTHAEFNAVSELLYSNHTVEVEIYNGKMTQLSSTKYCSSPNGILRLNIRTTKDSSNE